MVTRGAARGHAEGPSERDQQRKRRERASSGIMGVIKQELIKDQGEHRGRHQ